MSVPLRVGGSPSLCVCVWVSPFISSLPVPAAALGLYQDDKKASVVRRESIVRDVEIRDELSAVEEAHLLAHRKQQEKQDEEEGEEVEEDAAQFDSDFEGIDVEELVATPVCAARAPSPFLVVNVTPLLCCMPSLSCRTRTR